ncbi:hypothetical protein CLOSBL3_12202 [Clostridiaceae bacterium BL-3]|nr:hypothetical protein CLOSBL3_12202 [Clostridiaceae bacterium BL-3]
MYKLNIVFSGLILDILPIATIHPKGMENTAVIRNNSPVIRLPFNINPVMSIRLSN